MAEFQFKANYFDLELVHSYQPVSSGQRPKLPERQINSFGRRRGNLFLSPQSVRRASWVEWEPIHDQVF